MCLYDKGRCKQYVDWIYIFLYITCLWLNILYNYRSSVLSILYLYIKFIYIMPRIYIIALKVQLAKSAQAWIPIKCREKRPFLMSCLFLAYIQAGWSSIDALSIRGCKPNPLILSTHLWSIRHLVERRLPWHRSPLRCRNLIPCSKYTFYIHRTQYLYIY